MNAFRQTILARIVAVVLCITLPALGVPLSAFAPDPKAPRRSEPEPRKAPASRPLRRAEQKRAQGKMGANPYVAGNAKWSVIHNGVDMITGNFTTAATDLSFEGGYGIPVNVTRTYSCNSADEGPFGRGWNLSVDIRTTAGGLLKSSGAPVRSVPNGFRDRPLLEEDGNLGEGSAGQPVEAVVSTDASGKEETIAKDVDGVLTTPSWDKNNSDPDYETVEFEGDIYQIMVSNRVTTPEGTVYVYTKQGFFDGGQIPLDMENEDPSPSNVLKITTVTDRHGNVTEYSYAGNLETEEGCVSFQKANGTTVETRLTKIEMPNGHEINFAWGDGSPAPVNRIESIYDNNSFRTVTYSYTGDRLTAVTTPAGYTTEYGYADLGEIGFYDAAPDLLTSITDPRGLETTIDYIHGPMPVLPYAVALDGVFCWRVGLPNGVVSFFTNGQVDLPDESPYDFDPPVTIPAYQDRVTDKNGALISEASVTYAPQSGQGTTVQVGQMPLSGHQEWNKIYDAYTQDLLTDDMSIRSATCAPGDLRDDRQLPRWDQGGSQVVQHITAANTYNFMGNPLSKQVTENQTNWQNPINRYTYYAYWGQDKYFQQKAVLDVAGRFTFTEYYDSSAQTGKKGQVWKVYDPKRVPVGGYTGTGTGWQDNLAVSSTYQYDYAAKFDYDGQGRPTSVKKLQSTNGYSHNDADDEQWIYNLTTSSYDDQNGWGNASQVVEDANDIGRETTTNSWDTAGRATSVTDAADKTFETEYDSDGRVLSVIRTDTDPDVAIVTYQYGDTGLENGMAVSVTDELSGVAQEFTYQSASGGGLGQVSQVHEDDGNWDYDVLYEYNPAGERQFAEYQTPNGNSRWRYGDYVCVGPDAYYKRVFQTMNKQSWTGSVWVDSTEEFHYAFDQAGRLTNAAFCQEPSYGSTYTAQNPAAHRAQAIYTYEPAGRASTVEHWWDELNMGGALVHTKAILGQAYAYENSSPFRGLRLSATFKHGTGSTSWTTDRTEYYGYDSSLDYLANVDYNDGYANEYQEWTYDAAGNRASDSTVQGNWTYDNLNRMTASQGHTYSNDILGNRTGLDYNQYYDPDARLYAWDELNRMSATAGLASGSGARYVYRADGMRIEKVADITISFVQDPSPLIDDGSGYYDEILSVNKPTTRYYYDGQMPMEEDFTQNETVTVTRYGIGARGIDYINRYNGSTTVGFPIYDGHGNMIATIGRNGSSYSIGDQKQYDVWGQIRYGNQTGEPRMRYCANLGHQGDDESGLIYMRARYYEPWTGRFVSEDMSDSGSLAFAYGANDPVNRIDVDGNSEESEVIAILADVWKIVGLTLMGGTFAKDPAEWNAIFQTVSVAIRTAQKVGNAKRASALVRLYYFMHALRNGKIWKTKGGRSAGIVGLIGYLMVVEGYLLDIEAESLDPYSRNEGIVSW